MTCARSFQHVLFVICAFFFSLPAEAQSVDRAKLEKDIETGRSQLAEKEKQFLAVAPEDYEQFADFLQQPDTGLVRLLPREKYDTTSKTVIRGGGAFYSFVRLTHEYGNGSDIELERDTFNVGFAGYDFGLFVVLTDTPLEAIAPMHPALQFLLDFTPPVREPEIRQQQRRCGEGMQIGDFKYVSHVQARLDTTYALRSVNYDRWDVLVTFRVIRQDTDGSQVLLWKKLKTFPVPKAERPKAAEK